MKKREETRKGESHKEKVIMSAGESVTKTKRKPPLRLTGGEGEKDSFRKKGKTVV